MNTESSGKGMTVRGETIRDTRTERLADWSAETKATTFAAWLRAQLGLPAVPV